MIVVASLIICNDSSFLSFPHQSHKSKFDQEQKQEQKQEVRTTTTTPNRRRRLLLL